MKKSNRNWGMALLLAASTAWAGAPVPVSGTFAKGPAIPNRVFQSGPILQIRGETGIGSVTGGLLTGSADYLNDVESINLNRLTGGFHMEITIQTTNGSVVVLGLDGKTNGANPVTGTVQVAGNWRLLSAEGPDAGLHGEGTFTGVENFADGSTTGNFIGGLH
jgi:hypothetical protein